MDITSSTQALHDGSKVSHLAPVLLIGFERCHLVRLRLAAGLPKRAAESTRAWRIASERLRPLA
jgi:hypothetical protein